jgi:putative endonuclease
MIRALLGALRRSLARGPAGGDPARRSLGRAGEDAAARMLRAAGYSILARNAEVGQGEADLVCLDPDGRTIVIVEVKTRIIEPGLVRAITGEAAITAHKRRKLLSVTRTLVRANRWHDRPVRIDVVAVDWRDGADPVLRHHRNAL